LVFEGDGVADNTDQDETIFTEVS